MTKMQKLMVRETARVAMASGAGMFIGKVTEKVFENCSLPVRVLATIGAGCCGFGVGSGVDYYFNTFWPITDDETDEVDDEPITTVWAEE